MKNHFTTLPALSKVSVRVIGRVKGRGFVKDFSPGHCRVSPTSFTSGEEVSASHLRPCEGRPQDRTGS